MPQSVTPSSDLSVNSNLGVMKCSKLLKKFNYSVVKDKCGSGKFSSCKGDKDDKIVSGDFLCTEINKLKLK